jgi:hypothetical protein
MHEELMLYNSFNANNEQHARDLVLVLMMMVLMMMVLMMVLALVFVFVFVLVLVLVLVQAKINNVLFSIHGEF